MISLFKLLIDCITKDSVSVSNWFVASSNKIILATDPDREGEAIAWHVEKLLRDNSSLSNLNIHRVTFNEITKNAVLDSLKEPREIDENLVNAYLARRALDFLVGFTLSPVLWRKLPGSKSAGRVQSVALRIITERELEIEKLKSELSDFKMMVEKSKNSYEDILDKTTKSIEKFIENANVDIEKNIQ